MRAALLVIDLQVGVLESCFDVDGVVARTCTLVERARDAGVPVIWVQHVDGDLPRGSRSWQLAAGLVPLPGEWRIDKAWCDAFADTPLRSLLEQRDIRRLVIAGAQSDYCIRATAQRATLEGYPVTLVSDAHTTMASEFGGVAVAAEQIVAHTNRCFGGLSCAGAPADLARHDQVVF